MEREAFQEALRRQIKPRREASFVVGWSPGNEFDEIITRSEIVDILRCSADVPAKRALVDFALEQHYGGDLAKMAKA
jgi:hypothetical protein